MTAPRVVPTATSVITATPTTTPTASQPSGVARIVITEPQTTSSAKKRKHPQFLSDATQSIFLAVNNVPTVYPFSDTSPLCVTNATSLVCTIDIPAPNGAATIGVTTYDQPQAQGYALATGSATATIAGTTVVPLSLNAIARGAAIALAHPNPAYGTSETDTVTVQAFDADGDLIVGTAPFSSPIPLFDSDTSGHTSLSATSVAGPGAPVTLSYDGTSVDAVVTAFNSPSPDAYGAAEMIPMLASTEYALVNGENTSGYSDATIAQGNDGALYLPTTNGLSRVSLSGATSLIPVTGVDSVAVGPNNNGTVWFTTNQYSPQLNRLNSDNSVTSYSIPSAGRFTLGSDRNFWIAGNFSNGIFKVTPDGTATAIPGTSSYNSHNPTDVTAGPDNNLWFADGFGWVDKVTTDGTPTFISLQPNASDAITTGSDGALWAEDFGSNGIAFDRVTTSGSVTHYATGLTYQTYGNGSAASVTRASDGNVWFPLGAYFALPSNLPDGLARITPSGQTVQFVIATPTVSNSGHIHAVFATSDGSIWYSRNGFVGKVTVPAR